MFVVVHVLIALSSVVYTTYLFFAPTERKFYVSYGLVGATILSGSYLIWSTHSRLLPACIAGLVYIGAVSVGIVAARFRFARASVNTRKINDVR